MSDTLFVFGAGINRGLVSKTGLQPPLARDFFQLVLNHPQNTAEHERVTRLADILKYIQRFWKLDRSYLAKNDFNIEELYTMLDAQVKEGFATWNNLLAVDSADLLRATNRIFVKHLMDFTEPRERQVALEEDAWAAYNALGKMIYNSSHPVLTFNYDTILESAIERASCGSDILPLSPRWKREAAYKAIFDEVVPESEQSHFNGTPSTEAPFLKLHGSVNWFEVRHRPPNWGDPIGEPISRLDLTEGLEDEPHRYRPHEVSSPLLLTPVMNKDIYRSPVIREVWRLARQELHSCTTLIVGGYSFPHADFQVRRLFLEVFENREPLQQLIVINPDTSVVNIVLALTHLGADGPVITYGNLVEFIQSQLT